MPATWRGSPASGLGRGVSLLAGSHSPSRSWASMRRSSCSPVRASSPLTSWRAAPGRWHLSAHSSAPTFLAASTTSLRSSCSRSQVWGSSSSPGFSRSEPRAQSSAGGRCTAAAPPLSDSSRLRRLRHSPSSSCRMTSRARSWAELAARSSTTERRLRHFPDRHPQRAARSPRRRPIRRRRRSRFGASRSLHSSALRSDERLELTRAIEPCGVGHRWYERCRPPWRLPAPRP